MTLFVIMVGHELIVFCSNKFKVIAIIILYNSSSNILDQTGYFNIV